MVQVKDSEPDSPSARDIPTLLKKANFTASFGVTHDCTLNALFGRGTGAY
jgi:hypothetical protein